MLMGGVSRGAHGSCPLARYLVPEQVSRTDDDPPSAQITQIPVSPDSGTATWNVKPEPLKHLPATVVLGLAYALRTGYFLYIQDTSDRLLSMPH